MKSKGSVANPQGPLLVLASPVIERLVADVGDANVSIVLQDGDGRVMTRHVVDPFPRLAVGTVRAPIINPRTGARIGSITLSHHASPSSPLLRAVARGAAREIGHRLHARETHTSRADRPMLGWGALTETERLVAELLASGLRNRDVADRLFMSRFTVDAHVRHIYQKLEIRSRAELSRIVTASRANPLGVG